MQSPFLPKWQCFLGEPLFFFFKGWVKNLIFVQFLYGVSMVTEKGALQWVNRDPPVVYKTLRAVGGKKVACSTLISWVIALMTYEGNAQLCGISELTLVAYLFLSVTNHPDFLRTKRIPVLGTISVNPRKGSGKQEQVAHTTYIIHLSVFRPRIIISHCEKFYEEREQDAVRVNYRRDLVQIGWKRLP